MRIVETGPSLAILTIIKFMVYLSVIGWCNSAYFLRALALDHEVDSWEFQKEQVKLTLWIVCVFILMELASTISSIGSIDIV